MGRQRTGASQAAPLAGDAREAEVARQTESRWADKGARSLKAFDPHRHDRSDSGAAFMDDPEDGPAIIEDDLAEGLAETFVRAATSTGEPDEQPQDEMVDEEYGGPFLQTYAEEEYAGGSADDLPADSSREPLPQAVSGLVQLSPDDDRVLDDPEAETTEGAEAEAELDPDLRSRLRSS